MSRYKIGIDRLVIGVAPPSYYTVAPQVVREQAKAAAQTEVNKKKKYFGYARLVPQADIRPEDQVLIKNTDKQSECEAWLQILSGDPQMIWAGYFDNSTGKLVKDTIGEAIVVTPEKPKKSNTGIIAGGVALGIGMIFASRKRR